ncbi:ImuA family protein [Hyphococcus sp.]|uniref:ImuA family protein n=1 Tax=Hyphococcus sp. TaxID=2038636 RepID=UPI003CCC2DA3
MNKSRTYTGLPELASARVHELSGPSAAAFAFLMASEGEIVLCGPPHWLSALQPEAAARFCDPNRILHALSPLEADILWSAETALRSGAASTVIVAAERSPSLTNFRRLQLAALAGKSLGLVIVNRPAASTAAETRWHCKPAYAETHEEFRIHASLYKNKKGIVGSWVLNVSGETNSLHLDAAPAGEPVWPERIAG